VPDQEAVAEHVKAWGWTIKEVQESGGRVQLLGGDDELTVRPDVDVEVVYVPPLPGQESSALREAQAVIDALNAGFLPLEDAAHVAEKAAKLAG
jgi:hypothetical protein